MNQFNCPHCGQTLQDDGSLAGQTVACPMCGQMFRLPGGPQPYVAPMPAQQPAPAAPADAGWTPPTGAAAAPAGKQVPAPPPDDGPDMSLPFEVAPASAVAGRVTRADGETESSKVMSWVLIGGIGFVVVVVAVISLFALLGGTSDNGGSGWKEVITRLEDSDTSREEADLVLRSGPKAVIQALEGITELDGDGLAISENACTALASLGSEIVGPLTAALHSDSPKARAGAARVLREMGATAKGAASDLGNCLDDNQRAIRLTAADALINLGADASPALDRVAAALTNSDSEVRRKAIKILVKLGPAAKPAIPALNMAGQLAPDYPTQKEARDALKVIDTAGTSAHVLTQSPLEIQDLVQTLTASESPVEERINAAKTLGSKGHEAAVTIPALYKTLRDEKEKSVRLAAAEALGHFGAEAYYIVPGLEAIAAGPDGEVAAAARAAADSIRPRKQ
jgi:hypothetical protein